MPVSHSLVTSVIICIDVRIFSQNLLKIRQAAMTAALTRRMIYCVAAPFISLRPAIISLLPITVWLGKSSSQVL